MYFLFQTTEPPMSINPIPSVALRKSTQIKSNVQTSQSDRALIVKFVSCLFVSHSIFIVPNTHRQTLIIYADLLLDRFYDRCIFLTWVPYNYYWFFKNVLSYNCILRVEMGSGQTFFTRVGLSQVYLLWVRKSFLKKVNFYHFGLGQKNTPISP